MSDENNEKTAYDVVGSQGFFKSVVMGIVRDAVKFVIAFFIGTGASAVVCWYYEIPLVFSLVGGFLVLGLALALMTDSIFS